MSVARIAAAAAAAVVVPLAVILLGGGGSDERYRFKLVLENALGLRSGSLVTVGGISIGKAEVRLRDDDKVEVVANLDKGEGPVGRDAKVFVTSVNLLGQRRIELDKGDYRANPAPSGMVIPTKRLTASTDLDQVLEVLTPDTRARLGVLLSEAGAAMVGRRVEISRLLDTLPDTMAGATQLLDAVETDNHTLADLVTHTDRLVGTLARERRQLGDLLDTFGQSARTVAARRVELRETLARAPRTLATLQSFLGQLERTTVQLGPAARDLSATAPYLERTLAQLPPFQEAAEPAIREAQDVAPALSRLAKGATPVLRRATPTANRLAEFAQEFVPVGNTLDESVDNLLAIVDNWAHAVQFRDGLSHVFRGEAAFTPQTLEALLNRFAPKVRKRRKPAPERQQEPAPVGRPDAPTAPDKRDPVKELVDRLPVKPLLDDVPSTVDELLKGAKLNQLLRNDQSGAPKSSMTDLLDFLLKP